MRRTPLGTLAAILLVAVSGCLPYSCRREAATELMPADSLSRQLATSVPSDTLELVWTAGDHLEYPRTVRFGGSNTLYVSDVERDAILRFSADGAFLGEIETLDVPYIAGIHGDTVAVFSPAGTLVHLYAGGQRIREVTIQDQDRPESSLVYAAYADHLYYKRVAPDDESFIARVGWDGRLIQKYALSGPYWRYAGLLRAANGRIISLSGFRPVVDILQADRLDTLALRGFDSPMLARSRSFMLGDVTDAPLLTSAAAVSDSRFFVVNIRAGWLQIDVFDRDGRLRQRLVQQEPGYQKSFFPQDIDVRRRADGSYQLAIVLSKPSPELRLYAWIETVDAAEPDSAAPNRALQTAAQ